MTKLFKLNKVKTFVYLQEICFCFSNTAENRNKKQNGKEKSPNLKTKECTSKESMDQRENKKYIIRYFTQNINENTTYTNLWNAAKVVFRGKYLTLNIYTNVKERCYQ